MKHFLSLFVFTFFNLLGHSLAIEDAKGQRAHTPVRELQNCDKQQRSPCHGEQTLLQYTHGKKAIFCLDNDGDTCLPSTSCTTARCSAWKQAVGLTAHCLAQSSNPQALFFDRRQSTKAVHIHAKYTFSYTAAGLETIMAYTCTCLQANRVPTKGRKSQSALRVLH
jgi:hypothetical protein